MGYNVGNARECRAVLATPPARHSGKDPEMRPKSIPPLSSTQQNRFWSKVEVSHPAGCWEWAGSKYPTGYGRFRIRPTEFLAHRVAYSTLIGSVPDGQHIDHLCRNRACVNP